MPRRAFVVEAGDMAAGCTLDDRVLNAVGVQLAEVAASSGTANELGVAAEERPGFHGGIGFERPSGCPLLDLVRSKRCPAQRTRERVCACGRELDLQALFEAGLAYLPFGRWPVVTVLCDSRLRK